MLEHGPQRVSHHTGYRLLAPQLIVMKVEVAGDILLSGKDEEIKEEQDLKDNKLKF